MGDYVNRYSDICNYSKQNKKIRILFRTFLYDSVENVCYAIACESKIALCELVGVFKIVKNCALYAVCDLP